MSILMDLTNVFLISEHTDLSIVFVLFSYFNLFYTNISMLLAMVIDSVRSGFWVKSFFLNHMIIITTD